MASRRFVAPPAAALTGGTEAEAANATAVAKALRAIQETLDSPGFDSRSQLITTSTTLRAGEFVRISPRQGRTLVAKLPKAEADNFGSRITISLERPNGILRVSAEAPDTVVGARATNFTAAGLIILESNGVDQWVTPGELPSTSPGGAALDAEYVLGVAHASLPNGRVATDGTEIDADLTTPNVISWALNTTSVVFAKLQNLTGLSVLGRAATSAGVMAAITATTKRHVLRANDGLTSLEWGDPVEIRNNANTDVGDVYSIRALNGTNTTSTVSAVAGGAVSLSWNVDDLPISALADVNARTAISNATNASAAPTAVQANTARHVYRDNATNTGLEWGYPIAVRANTGTAFDTFQCDFIDGTHTTSAVGGSATNALIQFNVNVATLLAAIDSTSIVVNANTLERAAITGAITIAQNSNSSLFSGIQANGGTLNPPRTKLNFLDSTTIAWTLGDSAGSDRINIIADRTALTGAIASASGSSTTLFAGIQNGGAATTDRQNLNFIGFTIADNAGNNSIDISAPSGGGPDVIQSFTTAGTSHDVALNAGTTVLRVDTGNSDWSITGFARAGGNFDGDRIVVMNGSNNASTGEFQHATGSAAGNQLSMIGSASQRGRRRAATFEYDGPDLAWRELANNGNGPFFNDVNNVAHDALVHDGTRWVVVNPENYLEAAAGTTKGDVIVHTGVQWERWASSFYDVSSTTVVTNSNVETNALILTVPANGFVTGAMYEMCVYLDVVRGATATAASLTVRLKTGGVTSANFPAIALSVTTNQTHSVCLRALWKCGATGVSGTIQTSADMLDDMATLSAFVPRIAPTVSGSFNTGSALNIGFSVQFSSAVSGVSVNARSGYIKRVN